MAACAAALAIVAASTAGGQSPSGPQIDGCPVFPASNPWNQRVDRLPVASDSARMIRRIGARDPLHPDFGSGRWHGGLIGLPQAILMGKNGVEGVLDADPRTHPDARLIPELSHIEAIERGLKVMDTTALSLCMDNGLPLYVFNLDDEHNIARIARGERLGTIISSVPGGLPVQVSQ